MNIINKTAADVTTGAREYLTFRLGEEEYGIDILKNVEERDYIDSHREVSPLRKASDAIELDNSNMTIAEQKAWLMEKYREAIIIGV